MSTLRYQLRKLKRTLRQVQAFGIPTTRPEVVDTLPHDPEAFTQGLALQGNTIIESTGLIGHSDLRLIDRRTGQVRHRVPVADHFCEGVAVLDSVVYQLTWKSGVVLTYDYPGLEFRGEIQNSRRGWGLTTAGEQFYTSSGSSFVELVDRQFAPVSAFTIRMNGLPLSLINDIAFAEGSLYFNVYRHERVYEADIETGKVKKIFDLSALARKERQELSRRLPAHLLEEAILNGIAIDTDKRLALVTGKYWSSYYYFAI